MDGSGLGDSTVKTNPPPRRLCVLQNPPAAPAGKNNPTAKRLANLHYHRILTHLQLNRKRLFFSGPSGKNEHLLVTEYVSLENQPRVATMLPPPWGNVACAGNPNPTCLQPFDERCVVINCGLPKLIPQHNAELGLRALDMLTFFGGPADANRSICPSLHPNCVGAK